jgi:hypothetical protein
VSIFCLPLEAIIPDRRIVKNLVGFGEDGRGWARMGEDGRGWARMGEAFINNLRITSTYRYYYILLSSTNLHTPD